MRRGRRGGHLSPEFGGSGEDSFVAVVVTKLTGALLFILLLTMVIMALIPRGEPGTARKSEAAPSATLAITTPEALPEAIAGRPYTLALAATGGAGPLRWSLAGELPEGLALNPATGVLNGAAKRGTRVPLALVLRVSDGTTSATRPVRLVVYQPTTTLATPAWLAAMPAVPVRAWLERGIGFLVLLLVHLVGMNAIRSLDRARAEDAARPPRRLAFYRATVRLTTLSAMAGLAAWLWSHRGA